MVYFKLEWNVYGLHVSLLVSHFDFCVKLTSDPQLGRLLLLMVTILLLLWQELLCQAWLVAELLEKVIYKFIS